MEKKKMTKAEAFEYLKGTRVYCGNYSHEVQRKIFETGVEWISGGSHLSIATYLFVNIDGRLTHCIDDNWFKNHDYRALSVDDILSIEIVKEKSEEEDALDLIRTVGARLSEVLRRMEGHKHVVITEEDVILYDEGMSLFHSDPF